MQPTPCIRRLFGHTSCMSCHAIDRPCANPMRAIMIAKSRFDTRVNVQYAPRRCPACTVCLLLVHLHFQHTKHQCLEVNTQDSTLKCAHFPSPCVFLHSCTPSFESNITATLCNVGSPSPSSLFFLSEVSLHMLATPCFIGRPSSSTLVAQNSSISSYSQRSE